jgi:hypothetical protein
MPTLARLAAILAVALSQTAVAEEFTWRGTLGDAGQPANGAYDFRVQLFAGEGVSPALTEPLELLEVQVSNGTFAAGFEFEDSNLTASGGWLEVAVREAGASAYRTLPGRSRVAAKGTAASCPASWNVEGNAGLTVNDFLGTTDAMALEFRANNQRVMRMEPGSSPNLVGGFSGNQVGPGIVGATIDGGGSSGNPNQVQATFGSIGGGRGNRVDASWGTVGGGRANVAGGSVDSTVGGGSSNRATGQTSTVGGGFDNQANALVATVAGGLGNIASSDRSSIGGGDSNEASGPSSTVPGGFNNSASGSSSVVGGGANNSASGSWSALAGGVGNSAIGEHASIAGGRNNLASGSSSHIAGGEGNCTGGRWSWVGGRGAHLLTTTGPTDSPCYAASLPSGGSDGSFMWAGGNPDPLTLSYPPNSFVVRATGGTYFHSADPMTTAIVGVRLASGAGDWSSLSDRNAKDDIEPVDSVAVLESLLDMPVYRWRWKTEAEDKRHIGPMAQDFHATYGLNGDDDRHILNLDSAGVALAAIQGLHQKLELQNAALQAQVAALIDRQSRLDKLLRDLQVSEGDGFQPSHAMLADAWDKSTLHAGAK